MSTLYGGIEAGGTKFVCIVGSGPGGVVDETRFPTTLPGETIQRAVDFFAPYVQRGELAALGIASLVRWIWTRPHQPMDTLPPLPNPAGAMPTSAAASSGR